MLVQFARVDRAYAVRDIDHPGGPDQRVQGHLVDRRAIGDEMHRRVDVRAAVRPHGVDRKRQLIALPHILEKIELERRVTLVHRSPRGIERRRHIDPPLSAQLARPLVGGRTSHHEAEQQRETQTRHAEDRLGDGPRLQRLLDGHVEELLDEPDERSPPQHADTLKKNLLYGSEETGRNPAHLSCTPGRQDR